MRTLAILSRGKATSLFWVIEPDSNRGDWDVHLEDIPIRGRLLIGFGTYEEAQQYVKDNS